MSECVHACAYKASDNRMTGMWQASTFPGHYTMVALGREATTEFSTVRIIRTIRMAPCEQISGEARPVSTLTVPSTSSRTEMNMDDGYHDCGPTQYHVIKANTLSLMQRNPLLPGQLTGHWSMQHRRSNNTIKRS